MTSVVGEAKIGLGRWYVRHGPTPMGKASIVGRYLNAGLRDSPRRRRARTRFGATFAIDTQDLIQRYLYMFGVWEPNLTHWLRRRLRPGDVFVDVGANIGYFSVLASRLVGAGGRVVAIEASPAFHDLLLGNARMNSCVNLRAANVAVSDREELLTFVLASRDNMGANSIVPYHGSAESTFEAQARPLPHVLTEEELNRARVIKIDVEGAEGAVIRGLGPSLDRLRADAELVVEVTPGRMAELGYGVDELLAVMGRHGFHAYRLANDYRAERYPSTISRPPQVPVRWRGPVVEECDLVFSRVEAATLS